MNVERAVRLIAGIFVLASLALGHWVNPYWYLFTAFRRPKPVPVRFHQLLSDDDVSAQAWAEPLDRS